MAIDEPTVEYERQYRTEPRLVSAGLEALRSDLRDGRGLSLVHRGASVDQAAAAVDAELEDLLGPP